MNIIERVQSPTPTFFKKVRKIGLILAAVSGAILAAPVALPATVITIATYLGLVGGVATAVSQTATEADAAEMKEEPGNGYTAPF
jgi:hypothetical protein